MASGDQTAFIHQAMPLCATLGVRAVEPTPERSALAVADGTVVAKVTRDPGGPPTTPD